MRFFKRKEKSAVSKEDTSANPVLVAVIQNTVSSEIFQDILRENQIPFICHQDGAGGYIKILTGGLLVADSIYVSEKNSQRAKELYEAYLNTELECADSEE